MKYVDLITAHDLGTALALMKEGWHLAGSDRSGERWVLLLGMPLHVGLVYDPDTRTYSQEVGNGRRVSGPLSDSGDHGAS